MGIERRIIPISSGKGGVGKTTIALNYALSLSRHGRTILVDLDTGTSSVRNCLDTPVERDLYHFFKKNRPLADCVTTLSPKLDPHGEFQNFGFVAGPKHLIEDITNFNRTRREALIDAINGLKANFIVLDLKAGLDVNVIEFLPFTNSGILVFTPHLPAATLAASDIVKAILFRKLRTIFSPGSPIYTDLKGLDHRFVSSLIDRVEDVYDESVHNLDAFVHDLHHALGDHPVVKFVADAVDSFVVHYVLNMFNGIRESYETAVRPFVGALASGKGLVPREPVLDKESRRRAIWWRHVPQGFAQPHLAIDLSQKDAVHQPRLDACVGDGIADTLPWAVSLAEVPQGERRKSLPATRG